MLNVKYSGNSYMIYFDYCCEERSCPLHFDIARVYASRLLLASYTYYISILHRKLLYFVTPILTLLDLNKQRYSFNILVNIWIKALKCSISQWRVNSISKINDSTLSVRRGTFCVYKKSLDNH